jgi:cysteine desulfurase
MWFSKRPYFAKASKGRRIYFDHASATPLLPEAAAAMRAAERLVGNPGAIHADGVEAKRALEQARERIAVHFGVKARELIFTSGLTEANNIAILGYARHLELTRRSLAGTHWLVSSIEHDSVLGCFSEVERLGGTVAYVDPDGRGIVSPETVARALRKETVFVSVGWANNEIGTVQPLAKIAQRLRAHEAQAGTAVVFHSDAGQAPLYLPTGIHSLGVDLLSFGAEKLYGPHGVGALYLSNRTQLAKTIFGGAQERGLRAGTENVALASGFAAALDIVAKERASESKRLEKLRDELARQLRARIPGLVINASTSLTTSGDLKHTLPHMLNVSIPNIQSEYVTLALDRAGIAVSTKSACREGEESRSHVVYALGDAKSASPSAAFAKEERAANTLRFSLGRGTRDSDVRYVAQRLAALTESSRAKT